MNYNFQQYNNHQDRLDLIKRRLNDTGLREHKAYAKCVEKVERSRNPYIRSSLIGKLELAISLYDRTLLTTGNPFLPHCPSPLTRSGQLFLTIQQDGLPIYIDHNKLVTGLGILGPQGSGKSRYIIHLCNELHRIDPNIIITIIDPKDGFGGIPGFVNVDLSQASFDLTPPPNISYDTFIFELMPILAGITKLIYGLDILNQAVEKALEYRKNYPEKTSLSLKDILEILKDIKVKGFRPAGYKDGCVTALSLIVGTSNLFACRRGITEHLFSRNTVINARCLNSEIQARFFAAFLLFWLYQRTRLSPETNKLKHIVIFDDATRFVGINSSQYDNSTNQLGHLLAVLRSTGVCFCFATQLPARIDTDILNLTRNLITIGNINGEENLRVIQSAMSLPDDQKKAIVGFKPREMLSFISGHPWAKPIHGKSPHVPDFIRTYDTNNAYMHMIKPWHSLTDIPQTITPQAEPASASQSAQTADTSWKTLVWDCINYPFDKVTDRVKRLGFSIRVYESAKNEAVQKGYIFEAAAGKTKYLVPTGKTYQKFGQPCPYERNVSHEHSFFVLLTAHILKRRPNIASVKTETPIGSNGATIDVTATDKSGKMTAYEVTLSTSNLLSNATKLQDTAYEKIVWVCRDVATTKAVERYFKKSSLPSDLVSKFEYIAFSKFTKNK